MKSFYYSNALCDLRLMNEKIRDNNLTYNSLLYLELINIMDGKCTVSKLAEMLNVSKPGVTLKLNELCKHDYVIKTQGKEDKRKSYLSVNIEKLCRMLRILTNINIKQENQ